MKLPKITTNSKSARMTISLPQNESDNIDAYAQYYAEVHKEFASTSEIVRHIVKNFIESDKDFLRFQKSAAYSRAAPSNNDVINLEKKTINKLAKQSA